MNVFDKGPPSCHFGDRPSPPAAPDLLHISTEQLLISTWRLSKEPLWCGSKLAGEPCPVPHQLLYISEARWDVFCLSHHRSAALFRDNLSFRLQLVLLARFPMLLGTQNMGLHCYPHSQRALHTNSAEEETVTRYCFCYLSFSLVCPSPLLHSDTFRTSKVLFNELPSAWSYSCTALSGHSSVSSASLKLTASVHCLHPYN